MAWKDNKGIWCRGKLDYLHDEAREAPHIMVPELKTTTGSAHPADWQSTFFSNGYDYQAAFYTRGLKKLLSTVRTVEFIWVVLEQKPPHGLGIVRMGSQAAEEASEMVEVGIEMWDQCVKGNRWPGYDSDMPPIDPAFWRSNLAELKRLAMRERMKLWQRPL
jgi:hypothetical protein